MLSMISDGDKVPPCMMEQWPTGGEDVVLKPKFEKAYFNYSFWGNGSKCCNLFGKMLGERLEVLYVCIYVCIYK